MSSIDLTRNTAFKSLLGGVDAGHKTDSVKLGADGGLKIGRSGLIGALTFRSAKAERGQKKAAEAIASAIVRCATKEMRDRIRANLGDATDVSPAKVLSALDEFGNAARTAANELLQKKETPGGRRLTVADVRDAINKVNALANEKLAGTSFIDKPRAPPPTARPLETRSPETLIHDAAGIISKAAQKDFRAGLEARSPNATEIDKDAAGFEKFVHEQVTKFLSEKAGQGSIKKPELMAASKLAARLIDDKLPVPKPPANPVAPKPQTHADQPRPPEAVTRAKVNASDVPRLAKEKADQAVAHFHAKLPKGGFVGSSEARHREAAKDSLHAHVRELATNSLLSDMGGDLDKAIAAAIVDALKQAAKK